MAPGLDVHAADMTSITVQSGASLVAGTIAYWRGLPNLPAGWAAELRNPANVKNLVRYKTILLGGDRTRARPGRVTFLWTGRVAGGDCLVDPTLRGCPSNLAGSGIASLGPFGSSCGSTVTVGGVSGRASTDLNMKRQAGAACPLIHFPPEIETGLGGGSGGGGLITYRPGAPSPTCASGPGCGGRVCSGFYCQANPIGTPPDFWDPQDPDHTSSSPGGGGGGGDGGGGDGGGGDGEGGDGEGGGVDGGTALPPIPPVVLLPPLPLHGNGERTYEGSLTYSPGYSGGSMNVNDPICTVALELFNAAGANAETVNPNANPLCGKRIRVTRGGATVVVSVVDSCPGCQPTDLDLSPSAFDMLAREAEGRVVGTWQWLE